MYENEFVENCCSVISSCTYFGVTYFLSHIKWVPCYHSMVHPRVVDGGMASSYGG
jgi:hypothetical protein